MTHSHLGDLLDLDAEVLHEFHREVITWAASAAPERARIVDLGAGTGTGTLALARHLPAAEVIAVDVSTEMLDHVRHRAAAAGFADRIRTVPAHLHQSWPDLGPADLVWASAALHHLGDPGHTLAQARVLLRPGGAFLITELESFPLFLSDTEGAAVEQRGHAVLAQARLQAGLRMGEDWTAHLRAAGFAVEAERRFDIALSPPLPAAAGRYARLCLERMRHGLDGRLSGDDLAALDTLAAGIADRADLTVRTTRTVWLARRPHP